MAVRCDKSNAEFRTVFGALVALCLAVASGTTMCTAQTNKSRIRELKAPVLLITSETDDQPAKYSALAVNVRPSGFIVTALMSMSNINAIKAVTDKKEEVPAKAIILLPAVGIAGVALDVETMLPTANRRNVTEGEEVQIVSLGEHDRVLFVNALVNKVSHRGDGTLFYLDVAIGGPIRKGLVIDSDGNCIGVIGNQSNQKQGTLGVSISAIEIMFSRWSDLARPSKER